MIKNRNSRQWSNLNPFCMFPKTVKLEKFTKDLLEILIRNYQLAPSPQFLVLNQLSKRTLCSELIGSLSTLMAKEPGLMLEE